MKKFLKLWMVSIGLAEQTMEATEMSPKKNKIKTATWNVQRMRTGDWGDEKLEDLQKHAEKRHWSVTLISDLKASKDGLKQVGDHQLI